MSSIIDKLDYHIFQPKNLEKMAQFISFNKNVEVSKEAVSSLANSMEKGKELRLNILKKHSIDLENGDWFLQQNWLNAFKEIADFFGSMNLFLIGKAIIENAKFPPINTIEEALYSIDVAYHMNHRLNGKIMFDPNTGKMLDGIGNYKLIDFNSKKRIATMVCNNPYPSKFDEGLITQIVRKYKPAGAKSEVKLDLTKENRLEGAESCTFLIEW